MTSQFDVTVAFLQNVYKQASLDSQKLQADMKSLRQQMEHMQKHIEGKTDNILREITPRIEQLQLKMKQSWGSIQGMDQIAWEQLNRQQDIFSNCQKIVKEMEERIDQVGLKV